MKTLYECRACGCTCGRVVLDLGVQPLANNLLRPEDIGQPEPAFLLRLAICESCWLLQLTDTVPPVQLFSEYIYFSSFSDALLRHAAEAAEKYRTEFALGPESFVVEIASNDGYLLKNIVAAGVPCLGIEPAANIAKVAIELGIPTVSQFFSHEFATELADRGQQADLIIGNNVFAHVPDINDFVLGLARLLKPSGRVVLEFPYACDLIEHVEFDTIYHEHVFYFTLTALVPLFAKHGLEVIDVERLRIHGGSLRLYIAHRGSHAVQANVIPLLAAEQKLGVATATYYNTFSERVWRIREDLVKLLRGLKATGKAVAAYGASAKGSTLLNFYGLGQETLDFVADRSTYKQGRITPGSHLLIIPAEELAKRCPDYTLLLTWNFVEEILEQQDAYRKRGGKFILPLPEVAVI